MPGDVEFLDARRRLGRHLELPFPSAASSYVRCAEEALLILPGLTDLEERAAVCHIAEAWLQLAETALAKRQD